VQQHVDKSVDAELCKGVLEPRPDPFEFENAGLWVYVHPIGIG